MNNEDKKMLEEVIVRKMYLAASAINYPGPTNCIQEAAEAVSALSNALLNIDACMDAEPIECEEEYRNGFVADEWYREEFKGESQCPETKR